MLQCGYHGWTYSLDGRLAATPEFDGVAQFDRQNCMLPQYRVECRVAHFELEIDLGRRLPGMNVDVRDVGAVIGQHLRQAMENAWLVRDGGKNRVGRHGTA